VAHDGAHAVNRKLGDTSANAVHSVIIIAIDAGASAETLTTLATRSTFQAIEVGIASRTRIGALVKGLLSSDGSEH
jgi:hypothetical protein